jgi:2-phospho-L-lactate guanylyltransferase
MTGRGRTRSGRAPSQVTAVVPVKPLALAKSRLALPADQRRALALAFAVDTISALVGSPLVGDVLVVTSDPEVAARLRPLGVRLAPDDGTGLREAVRAGIGLATSWRPAAGVAVVPADLPCLRAEDVAQVLTAATSEQGSFVPDRSGTGTTFVVLPAGRTTATRYGPGSARRHRSLGLQALSDAPARARHDVDTLDDLRAADALGPGAETAGLRPWVPAGREGGLLTPRWRPTP